MDFFQKVKCKLANTSDKKWNHRFPKCDLFKSSISHPRNNADPKKETYGPIIEPTDSTIFVGRPPPDFRLVLFKEHGDTSDRINIFDSKCYQKVPCASECQSESNLRYDYVKFPSDWNMLAEMLFGSVGMAQKAPAIKVHSIHDPPQIMISRVFCLPSFKWASLDQKSENSLELKCGKILSRRKARTMPMPAVNSYIPSTSDVSYSNDIHRSDSSNSLSSFLSLSGSLGSGLRPSVYMQSKKSHSLPQNQRNNYFLQDDTSDKIASLFPKRIRIGFSVLCRPEPNNYKMFQQFFFERFPIFEIQLNELKENIEKALKLKNKADFVSSMMQALDVFSSKLNALYTTPRLPEPVWPTLSTVIPENHYDLVVRHFIGDLSRIVINYNTKQSNYFFSGLLTAVLTHHLGWVGFAAPSDELQNNCNHRNYNALWAQLGDLYGAVGSPTKVCKTVVSGSESHHETISTVLSVLSFFIQCSHLKEDVRIPDQLTPLMLKNNIDPLHDLKMDLVNCEMEEDEYVFISFDNESSTISNKQSKKENMSRRNGVKRSQSSPYSLTETSLIRSNSGPMMKSLGNKTNVERHRTYSNDAKIRPVQSRRMNDECVKKTSRPAKMQQSTRTLNATNKTSNFPRSPFLVKQCIGIDNINHIDWPKVPTHLPDDDKFIKHAKSTPTLRCTATSQETSSKHCTQSIVDFIDPPVEHAVQLQSSCSPARTQATSSVGSLCPTQRKLPVCKKNEPNCLVDNQEKYQSALLTKSNSNFDVPEQPSKVFFSGDVQPKVQSKASSTSSFCKSIVDPNTGSSNKSKNSNKLKLMRIPSVELNHNAFDEYFDDCTNDTPPLVLSCDSDHIIPLTKNTEKVSQPMQTLTSGQKVPPLFMPSLHFERINPPLPSKGPVGMVSFTTSNEEVTFHDTKSNQMFSIPQPSSPVFHKFNNKQSCTLEMDKRMLHLLPVSDMKSPHIQDKTQFSPSWDSLMADFNEEYLSNFVLHGVPNQSELHNKILKDLHQTSRNPPVDEPVSEAVCIHADVDNCVVKVYSSQRLQSDKPCLPALTSKLVCNILQRVAQMFSMKISPQYCMVHLKSELRQLVLKSRMLAEYVKGHKRVTVSQLSAVLGIESQDLPLLMSVASCHSPHVAPAMPLGP